MLSQEAHELTMLIITRQSLKCRAGELDDHIQLATTLYEAPLISGQEDGLDEKLEELISELLLVPSLLASLDVRISDAWGRLRSTQS